MEADDPERPGALLRGIRVVELARGIPVAYCGRQFAAWGAEVVRLETGDGSPLDQDAVAATPEGGHRRLQWEYLMADKALLPGAGRDRVRQLIEQADVLITDWRLEELDRAGLDVGGLRAANRSLVVLRFTEFSGDGAYAGLAGAELILQALTGYLSVNGSPGRPPLGAPGSVIAYACGVSAFAGTLAALFRAEATGTGQDVEVAGLDVVASFVQYIRTQYYGVATARRGNNGPPMLPCADGHLYFHYLLEWSRSYLTLALGIDESDIPTDLEQIEAFFAAHTRDVRAVDIFRALGSLGATCGAVQTLAQVLDDEHLQTRKFFSAYPLPTGEGRFAGTPVRVRDAPLAAPQPPRTFAGWTPRGSRPAAARAAPASNPPLAGVRVLDVTTAWLGPYAAMLLSDLGADVIKVEGPQRPDVWRAVAPELPPARAGAHQWNICHYFNSVNRGKRGLTLDLNSERGRELFLQMVDSADILLENYSPRVLEHFGLGHRQLLARNPRLVAVSFSGYGADGPYRDFKAHGATIECMAGWVSLFGYDSEELMTMGEYPVDSVAGLHMAAAAMMGLLRRNRTGTGTAMEGSMLETAASYIGDELLLESTGSPGLRPRGNRHREMVPHGVFPCEGADTWVAIACRDDADWQRLGAVTGNPRMRDPSLATASARRERVDEVEAMVAKWTRQRGAREAMDALQRGGVPAGEVLSTAAALADPGLRDWFVPMDHADLGTHLYYGFPWSFSESRLSAVLPPVRLGEDSRDILRDELHLTDAEIDALVEERVTGAVLEAESPVS